MTVSEYLTVIFIVVNNMIMLIVALSSFISIVSLILSIVVFVKVTSKTKRRESKIKLTLQLMFGRQNYRKLLDDSKGDCNSCPFTTCVGDDCESWKKRIRENDSQLSPWIKMKYKEK